jgi:hypothetical protein
MSNTRTAPPGSGFRQERFASSPEFERGIMANLVARRCELLTSRSDRQLIWFLQLLSHLQGGLEKLASAVLSTFPEANATPSMRRFGTEPGQVYNVSQVKAVRAEIPDGPDTFRLSREISDRTCIGLPDIPSEREDPCGGLRQTALRRHREAAIEADQEPREYPAEAFSKVCQQAAGQLPEYLAELCLNPAIKLDNASPWWFPTLVQDLQRFLCGWVEQRQKEVVFTGLGKQVCETLEYTMEGQCLTVIDGLARTGKTHAAKAWCEMNPGRARYIQVPSTNDDIGFFRAIAKAIGVSINLNSKAQELRQRIEEAVQSGDLILVFDEAHYLWPNGNYRLALPSRLNWIMTALINKQVPVCLITTPQFFLGQRAVEQRTHWTSEQFIGRIGHYEKLPDSLSESDLFAVARATLPEGDNASIEMLVRYAQGSAKYLAAIESAARRARFLAKKAGRGGVVRMDVKSAIANSVIPSDSALAKAMLSPLEARKQARQRTQQASVPSFSGRPSQSEPRGDLLPGDVSDSETVSDTGRLHGRRDASRFSPADADALTK